MTEIERKSSDANRFCGSFRSTKRRPPEIGRQRIAKNTEIEGLPLAVKRKYERGERGEYSQQMNRTGNVLDERRKGYAQAKIA
jgi:hypothetical protein